jgi:hypothetical protein
MFLLCINEEEFFTSMFLLCRNEEEMPNCGTFEKHEAKKIAASSTPLLIDHEQTEDGGL